MACFNYMVILGEFNRTNAEGEKGATTGYEDLYSSMIRVPYLGSLIPVVLPGLVVAFAALFAILSALNLKNKALSAFKKVSDDSAQS
jgi:hypothetical protein